MEIGEARKRCLYISCVTVKTVFPKNGNSMMPVELVVLAALLAAIGMIGAMLWMIKIAVAVDVKAIFSAASPEVVDVAEVPETKKNRSFTDVEMNERLRFTSQQLSCFTSSYSTSLGSGGCCVVYKGRFSNGVRIAVKVLHRNLGAKIEAQFMTEVGIISRIQHKNLVRLYGFCYESKMKALVYEYMEIGSLDKYLFTDVPLIEWEKLHDIAIETAKGIEYLHEQRIIHYDIKPANVLLDSNFSAKVSDFGLAKLYNKDNSDGQYHSTDTEYRGTPGYSAPELILRNHPVTHKCDVYSYGMLLFEIVGRRRNTADASSDSINWFPKHVWDEYERGELAGLTVTCNIEEKDRERAERMCTVGLWCAQDSPEARPTMSHLVKMLEGRIDIVPPPKPFRYLYSVGIEKLKSVNGTNR